MAGEGFFSIDSLRGVWVLVVDADPRGRQALVDVLSYCGALVTPIASSDDAFAVMRRIKPDALVVGLADDESLAFIGRVRRLKPEDGGVVPAVAVPRRGDDDLVRSRGFQGCVHVPLDPWGLCRLVSNLLTVP
jgi:DNA-binding response OmpR family regulator